MTIQYLSKGFACLVFRCSEYATHEESIDGGKTWDLVCNVHCNCSWKHTHPKGTS